MKPKAVSTRISFGAANIDHTSQLIPDRLSHGFQAAFAILLHYAMKGGQIAFCQYVRVTLTPLIMSVIGFFWMGHRVVGAFQQ